MTRTSRLLWPAARQGWPHLGIELLNDNNKAQRNMQVFGYTGSGNGSGGAIVHNGDTITRDLHISIVEDHGDIAAMLIPKIRFIGGSDQRSDSTKLESPATFTLPYRRPGEKRWVEITVDGVNEKVNRDSVITLYELDRNMPINGYSFVFRPMELDDVIRQNVFQHAAVFSRLAALGQAGARTEAERAKAMLKQKQISSGDYVKLIRTSFAPLRRGVQLSKRTVEDPFAIPKAIEALEKSDIEQMTTQHLSLLNHIDMMLTMDRKSRGDRADVVQMMRWQRELLSNKRFASADLISITDRFIEDFVNRKVTLDEYARVLREMQPSLKRLTSSIGDLELSRRYEALAKADGIEPMERAHRNFLLRTEELSR